MIMDAISTVAVNFDLAFRFHSSRQEFTRIAAPTTSRGWQTAGSAKRQEEARQVGPTVGTACRAVLSPQGEPAVLESNERYPNPQRPPTVVEHGTLHG